MDSDGDGVVIVDAGGGMIDISSYSKNIGEVKDRPVTVWNITVNEVKGGTQPRYRPAFDAAEAVK